MRYKAKALYLLSMAAELAFAANKPPAPVAANFFNAYTLNAMQADLSLLGVSRVALADTFEIQGSILSNLAATSDEAGIPYHLGIKHHMWQKGEFTSAFSNLLFLRSYRHEGDKTDFSGSFNGIITSYQFNQRFNINFAPYWAYIHQEANERSGKIPMQADIITNYWLFSLGFDLRLFEKIVCSANAIQVLNQHIRANTTAAALSGFGNYKPTENITTLLTIGYRFKYLDLELWALQNKGQINLVWRIR